MKVKISEAQYKAISEMIQEGNGGETFSAVPKDAKNVGKAAKELQNAGLGNTDISLGDAENVAKNNVTVTGQIGESYLVSKKQIKECREKYLKDNSKLYSLNDFVKRLK